jgi:nitroreductase
VIKTVNTDYPVHEYISKRWSPYAFSEKRVKKNDLLSIFEAARWAPSAHNEQPRHYIVATKEAPEEFERILSCLVEPNQAWAQFVPVLALGVTKLTFSYNDQPNRAAHHDLGLASANLLFEATSRGLYVHQMIGILPDRAREVYEIPEGYEAVTAIAIGYLGENADLPEKLKKRDAARKPRKPLSEFVFSGQWNQSASILI